ncbi:hypothetical protein H310_07007 [Aphanomyces invadans]|uniref:Peptidase M16 N-terminal domain-containing protein n=1 Tax=Aphanomyces invadans TaxID=157072 RepID=A0A024U3A6_9STRA|nr:hypothetical protein H310_07007 [Aphanomyces invadans]ETW00362.1 hypothetical protein H310_07007 [Aphanomyces invadans]|eukprot:XP_008870497.1 hypothetical protein H310_07007 [Aphanomyces invadans]
MSSMSLDAFKSPNDRRLYRLTVLPNGLQVLLIQCQSGGDLSFDDGSVIGVHGAAHGAACVTVEVGSFADPPHLQGLAHYVEHMLFLGSTKYPDENEFEAYLSTHGGYTNATTDCESTSFVFEVNAAGFEHALDMFANFFVAPLLHVNAMERELCAIASEFQLASQNDHVRMQQVLCWLSPRSHPYHNFSWGNQLSLGPQPGKTSMADTNTALREFFEKYYTANAMKLVVCSTQDLDTLEAWAANSFGAVRTGRATPSYRQDGSPFHAIQSQLIKMIPLRDMHAMHIYFALPPLLGLHRQKPAEYIRYIVSNECNGSLISTLTKVGWATAIVAGVSDTDGYESGSYGSQFEVELTLSDQGIEHWDEIVEHVFACVNLLKQCPDLPAWVFDELKASSELAFLYNEPVDPLVACKELSRLMQSRNSVPLDDLLRTSLFQGPFQPDLVRLLLPAFSVKSLRVVLLSSSFEDDRDVMWTKEPWFGTRYTCETIDPRLEDTWSQSNPIHAQWPWRNPYIPTDFRLMMAPSTTAMVVPYRVRGHDDLWVLPDLTCGSPRVNACIHVALPTVHRSVDALACALMYCEVVNHALREHRYLAECAEMVFDLTVHDFDLEVLCRGYSQHIGTLLSMIFQTLAAGTVDVTRFDTLRRVFVQNLHNKDLEPSEKSRHLRLLVLDSTAVETHGICAAVEAMSASTLASFVKSDMFTNARITGFFHGNVDDTCAEAMWALVKQHVATATARSSDAPSIHTLDKKPHALVLPTSPLGRGILVRQPSEHVEEVNSFVEIYYQLGVRDIASNAYANLIQHIMNEPLYSTLRSRDQMGYDVGCCVRNTHGVLGFSISVQSSAYSASEIALRLDKFVHVDFPYVLESLDDDTFEAHVAARKAAWHHAHRANLDTATSLYWDEIISQRFEFNSRDLFLDVLSTVTKADCIARYHEWFVVAATRKKMRVHVVGQNHRATHIPFESIVEEDVAPAVVTDLAEFKRSRPSIHRACGPTWSV